jgi:hypothetical protein
MKCLLGRTESLVGMFQCLFGELVAGPVIFFSVVCRGSTVGVGGKFVKFSGSLVRVIWHWRSDLSLEIICGASVLVAIQ